MIFNHLKKMHFFVKSNKNPKTLEKDVNLTNLLDDSHIESEKPVTADTKQAKPPKPKVKKQTKPIITPAKTEAKPTSIKIKKQTKPAATKTKKQQEPKQIASPENLPSLSEGDQANMNDMFADIELETQTPPTTPEVPKISGATGKFKEEVTPTSSAPIRAAEPVAATQTQHPLLNVDSSTFGFKIKSDKASGVSQNPSRQQDFSYKKDSAVKWTPSQIFLPTNMHEHLNPVELQQWKKTFQNKIKNHSEISSNDKALILKKLNELYGNPTATQFAQKETGQKLEPAEGIKQKFKQFLQRWRSYPKIEQAVASKKPEQKKQENIDLSRRKFLGLPKTNKSLLTKSNKDDDLANLLSTLDDFPKDSIPKESSPPSITTQKPQPKQETLAPKKEQNQSKITSKPRSEPEFKLNYQHNHPKNLLQHLINRIPVYGKRPQKDGTTKIIDDAYTRSKVLDNTHNNIMDFVTDFPEHAEDVLNKVTQFIGSNTETKTISALQNALANAHKDKVEQIPLENFKTHIYDRIKQEADNARKQKLQNTEKPSLANIQARTHVHGPGHVGTTSVEFEDPEESDNYSPEHAPRKMWNAMVGPDTSGVSKVVADIFRESFGLPSQAMESNTDETRIAENLYGLKTGQERGSAHKEHKQTATEFKPPEPPNLFTSAETITTPSETQPVPGSTRNIKDIANISPQYYREYMSSQAANSVHRDDYIRFKMRHEGLKTKLAGVTNPQENENAQPENMEKK